EDGAGKGCDHHIGPAQGGLERLIDHENAAVLPGGRDRKRQFPLQGMRLEKQFDCATFAKRRNIRMDLRLLFDRRILLAQEKYGHFCPEFFIAEAARWVRTLHRRARNPGSHHGFRRNEIAVFSQGFREKFAPCTKRRGVSLTSITARSAGCDVPRPLPQVSARSRPAGSGIRWSNLVEPGDL